MILRISHLHDIISQPQGQQYLPIGKMQRNLQISFSGQVNQPMHHNQIVIGYYNLRGKAQVCRLLCQYLGVQYQDKLFSLAEWQLYAAAQTREWPFVCLPFLREDAFIVTESVSMCVYVINRFGSPALLGEGLRDRGLVDMYIWTIEYMGNVITINCQQKNPEELRIFKEKQWTEKVLPRLEKLEQAAGQEWFLGYLTIVDFSIYELVRYIDCIFDNKAAVLPKLKGIEARVAGLPAIAAYEQSSRAIVEWCPTKLLAGIQPARNASN